MKKEEANKINLNVQEFIAKIGENTNYNSYFEETLKEEIECIILNGGQIAFKGGTLRGWYNDKEDLCENPDQTNKQILTVITNKELSAIIIDCPEYSCVCDDPKDINYKKKIEYSFHSDMLYQLNEMGVGEISKSTESQQKIAISPTLVRIIRQSNNIIVKHDANGEEVSYSEKERTTSMYKHPKYREIIKCSNNDSEFKLLDIDRKGDYCIVKSREALRNGKVINQVFTVETEDRSLASIASLKNDWKPLTAAEYHELMANESYVEEDPVKTKTPK